MRIAGVVLSGVALKTIKRAHQFRSGRAMWMTKGSPDHKADNTRIPRGGEFCVMNTCRMRNLHIRLTSMCALVMNLILSADGSGFYLDSKDGDISTLGYDDELTHCANAQPVCLGARDLGDALCRAEKGCDGGCRGARAWCWLSRYLRGQRVDDV